MAHLTTLRQMSVSVAGMLNDGDNIKANVKAIIKRIKKIELIKLINFSIQ